MSTPRHRKSDGTTRLIENGDQKDMEEPSNIKGDRLNIALLLFLYTLQGIPLGLAAAIPMLLQNRGISYREQVCLKKSLKIFLYQNNYLVNF